MTVLPRGARAAAQASLQSSTMGGPPLNSLIIQRPYFVGSPETVLNAFNTLHQCGVCVVDMVFTIGTHAQQENAMELFSGRIMPTIQGWDETTFADETFEPRLAASK